MVRELSDKHLRAINAGRKKVGLKPIRRKKGTTKGEVRKTARRAFEPKKSRAAKNREKSQKHFTNYPSRITIEDMDDIPWSQSVQFADEQINPSTIVIIDRKSRIKAARALARSIGGRVYYQGEGMDGERRYSTVQTPGFEILEVVKR
jgi:hypothetical protein